MDVLVLNCGSSSAKFAVIDPATSKEEVSGIAQRLGSPDATLDWKRNGTKESRPIAGAGHEMALRAIGTLLNELGLTDELVGIGHRVVHGGSKFSGSMAITPEVIAKVEECIPLGPLHNPPNLVGIRIAQELFPALPQVGVFDTAFHQTMPPVAYTYPVPYEWLERHSVRRYGFHGTSHRFVAQQALQLTGLSPENHRLVTAHLGNGCSCAAVRDGKSVDTTMGLTPLEGVMMGTRSGSVDPAIIGHVAGALGKPADQILDALNKKSGLLGVSGLSNDMRTVEAAAEGGQRARAPGVRHLLLRARQVDRGAGGAARAGSTPSSSRAASARTRWRCASGRWRTSGSSASPSTPRPTRRTGAPRTAGSPRNCGPRRWWCRRTKSS